MAEPLRVGVVPKSTANPYFVSCQQGAEEAAAELGVDLLWDGPDSDDAARQARVVEALAARGAAVIAVSAIARSLSPSLRTLRRRGVKVLTWDADADPAARDFFVTQATPGGIAQALAFEAARILLGRGELAILTTSQESSNQRLWLERMQERLREAYPELRVGAILQTPDEEESAREATVELLRSHPELGVVVCLFAPGVPGVARAVKASGSVARVMGLSTPDACRDGIADGSIESVVTWSTVDLGYLTVQAAAALATGTLAADSHSLRAGRLGTIMIRGDEVRLGRPHIVNRASLADFL
jgi:rhamnose transport system permease protein